VLKGVALLHDSVRQNTAAHTVETLHHLNFEVLEHPLYSPDLALSDYHLFGPLKDTLRGCHFASDQELKEVVHAWLVTQPKTVFSEGIQKLVSRWTKFIAKEGDCVEKLCSCKFCIVVVLILKDTLRILSDSPSYIWPLVQLTTSEMLFCVEHLEAGTNTQCYLTIRTTVNSLCPDTRFSANNASHLRHCLLTSRWDSFEEISSEGAFGWRIEQWFASC
jgi:hypothetical protein